MVKNKPALFVTGGTGFLGRHLVRRCCHDYAVTVLTRQSAEAARAILPDPAIEIETSGKSDLEGLFAAKNFVGVIHCAVAYGRTESQAELTETNVTLPVHLAALAAKHGGGLFIHIDTFFRKHSEQYDYLREYRHSKKEVVAKLRSAQGASKIVNLVLEHLYGPEEAADKFLPMIIRELRAQKPTLKLSPGDQRRDFIYVDDVVAAIKLLLNCKERLRHFEDLELGTGLTHSIQEVVILLRDLTRSSTILQFGALPHREHEMMESYANIEAMLALGWTPKISLVEGLRRTIDLDDP